MELQQPAPEPQIRILWLLCCSLSPWHRNATSLGRVASLSLARCHLAAIANQQHKQLLHFFLRQGILSFFVDDFAACSVRLASAMHAPHHPLQCFPTSPGRPPTKTSFYLQSVLFVILFFFVCHVSFRAARFLHPSPHSTPLIGYF
jgi:hypothetical protein